MKTISAQFFVLITTFVFFGYGAIAQAPCSDANVDLTLKYDKDANVFEVYGRSDTTMDVFQSFEGNVITVIMPEEVSNSPVTMVQSSGLFGTWGAQTPIFSPPMAPDIDVHPFRLDIPDFNFSMVEDEEFLMFSFQLPDVCAPEGLRLHIKGQDPHDEPGFPYSTENFLAVQIEPGFTSPICDIFNENYDNDGTEESMIATIFPGDTLICTTAILQVEQLGDDAALIEWSTDGPGVFDDENAQLTTVSNLEDGDRIFLFAENAFGCAAEDSITINTELCCPAVFITDVVSIDSRCDQATGSATIQVSGSDEGYYFVWIDSNGDTTSVTNQIEDVSPGVYTAFVRADIDGCPIEDSVSVAIGALEGPNVSLVSVSEATCESSDGSAEIEVSGGLQPYSFEWSDGSSDQNLSDALAGMYNVTVTDANGCDQTLAVEVGSNSGSLDVNLDPVDAACGEDDGSILATPTGGQAPFEYEWSDGSTSDEITDLSPGVYTVTVTDDNGCVAIESAVISDSDGPNLSIDAVTDVDCFGSATGSIEVSSTDTEVNFSVVDAQGQLVGTGELVEDLIPGVYSVFATDDQGCRTVELVEIEQPDAPLFLAFTSSEEANCESGFGSIGISVSGGTSPYSVLWSNGAETMNLSGIEADEYSVTVTDDNDCTITGEFTLEEEQDCCPVVQIEGAAVTDSECLDNTGRAAVEVNGSDDGYIFRWEDSDGITVSTDSLVTSLEAGVYTVFVQPDVMGCEQEDSLQVVVGTLQGPSISVDVVNDATCLMEDGSVEISVSGGAEPYEFEWSDGSDDQNLSNVGAGTYSVTVTDDKGCEETALVTIEADPGSLTVDVTVDDDSDCGLATGSLTADANNGNAPYNFEWSIGATTATVENLRAGLYEVTVTDNDGCEITATGEISDVNGPELSVESTSDVDCFGKPNGEVSLSSTDSDISFEVRNAGGRIVGVGTTVSDLPAGTYFAIATDDEGCKTIAEVNIDQPVEPLVLRISGLEITDCNNNEGEISTTVTGGTSPYTFDWSPGTEDGPILENVTTGTYTVEVTDDNDCMIGGEVSIEIDEEATANAEITNLDPICFDGTINLSETGGDAVSWLWSTDGDGVFDDNTIQMPTLTGYSDGEVVTVQITTEEGCTDEDEVTVVFSGDCAGSLTVRLLLQGGTDSGDTLMRTDLLDEDLIPLNDPYTGTSNPRFTHFGSGGLATTTSAVLAMNAGTDQAIVDWVFIELRSDMDPTNILQTRSALVTSEGNVVDPTDGESPLEFSASHGQEFYVSVKHRNHLGVMTANPVAVLSEGSTVDFRTMDQSDIYTDPSNPLTNFEMTPASVFDGKRALWGGDANSDGQLLLAGAESKDNIAVQNLILTESLVDPDADLSTQFTGVEGYFNEDINMDGDVRASGANNDILLIQFNLINLSQEIQNEALLNWTNFVEQLP